MMNKFLIAPFVLCCFLSYSQQKEYTISSPDKKIQVSWSIDPLAYKVFYQGKQILRDSKLGLIREDEDFSINLKVAKVSKPRVITDQYQMLTAKKSNVTYTATQQVIET